MTTWIKFSERKPETEGDYLYSEDGEFVRCLNWSPERKEFWDPYSDDGSGLSRIDDPEYWAEITPPLAARLGYSIIPGTGGLSIFEYFNRLKKESPMSEKPLCKDCKWIKVVPLNPDCTPICMAPKAPRSIVDGESIEQCWCARFNDVFCGPEGRWFEAKEVPAKEYRFECFCYFQKTPGSGMEPMWIAQVSKPMQIFSGPDGFPHGCAKTPTEALCQAIKKAVKEEG